jgi:hypothetical protein
MVIRKFGIEKFVIGKFGSGSSFSAISISGTFSPVKFGWVSLVMDKPKNYLIS